MDPIVIDLRDAERTPSGTPSGVPADRTITILDSPEQGIPLVLEPSLQVLRHLCNDPLSNALSIP